MKLFFLVTLSLSIISCRSETSKKETDTKKTYSTEERERLKDSIVQSAYKTALFDTVGLFQAPIKITSAKLVKKEYSSYKDIKLSYKNTSGKRIEAIRFSWYGLNAFGDPADMGTGIVQGFGGGFTDEPLNPGKSSYGEWGILSRDGKKVVLAWPTEVVFSDGTKWEIGKAANQKIH